MTIMQGHWPEMAGGGRIVPRYNCRIVGFGHNFEKARVILGGCSFPPECSQLAITIGSSETMLIEGASSQI
jgi:hypothetical protein